MSWNEINVNEIPDGVYYDMPIDIYHANKTHLSASSIKESFDSLAHFKAYLDKKEERKIHFDFGNAFELCLTDYTEFVNKVAIFDDTEKPSKDQTFAAKVNKEWREDFNKTNEDKLIIPISGAESLDILLILKDSFAKHETAKTLILNAAYQTSIFWTDKETGLQLKTRPDFWKPANGKRGAIVPDLKTDKDTTSDKHLRAICDRNYPIQAVMQMDGLLNAGLIPDIESTRYFWIFCCKTVPYNTEVYEFDSSDIELFMNAYKFKLEEIARAKKNGLFLSYDPAKDAGIKTVYFPYYYKQRMGITENIDSNN